VKRLAAVFFKEGEGSSASYIKKMKGQLLFNFMYE